MFPPSRRVSPHRFSIFTLLLLLLVGPVWGGRAKAKAESSDAVVAIGDVHGDFDDFTAILQQLNELETYRSGRWQPDKREMTSAVKFLDKQGALVPSRLRPDEVASVMIDA